MIPAGPSGAVGSSGVVEPAWAAGSSGFVESSGVAQSAWAAGSSGVAQSSWEIEQLRGSVPALLEAPEPALQVVRLARIHTVTDPGLVLGSIQKSETADAGLAASAGVEVARRRSGGGSVLLLPEKQVWADFFITPSDPLWHDDVALAAGWVGRLWRDALSRHLPERESRRLSLHTGRAEADRWGRLVCFAGRGPGEVLAGDRKVVGVSQRRSRHRARFQTTARVGGGLCELDETDLLDLPPADREAGRAVLAERCGAVAATAQAVTESLLQALAEL
ncbi:MAG: hypothetical protein OXE79_07965 [Acidimicrobiaceae bacterium]|nr:hypothetical protein [Acidimicrobiaceae bacterium]MCY4280861.1 hypothetical protein [Acidimicrobiaceae bacterium]